MNMAGEHSSKQYDQELEAIRSKVLLMGGMVETQFDEALNCFRVGDAAKADKVMADDHAVNQLEVQLDDACSHLIVRRQPAANDLRTVMATVKVITDLERIGDEASKIARTAKSLHERGMIGFNHYDIVRTISRAAADMLHDALDAFARLDGKAALQIIARDDEIDHEFRTIIRNMITFMMEDPRTISSALDTLWVAKAVERIGDHAKNIAEYVIYVAEGRDIRHSNPGHSRPAMPEPEGH
jgi:phosphate transport system protein